MAHVTFIHGMGNKPPKPELLDIWLQCLAETHENSGIDLAAEGVSSEMVYWADLFYEHAVASSEFELDELNEASKKLDEIESGWSSDLPENERVFVDGLSSIFSIVDKIDENDRPSEQDIGIEFERVPLPWWLRKRIIQIFIRDLHHYLFNFGHVQDEIRQRCINTLGIGANHLGKHIIVSHGIGTVIAYDCLKRVPACPSVDGLITLGSPLGIDEVQNAFGSEFNRTDGFPSEKLKDRWVNIFDYLDPIAALDPFLANDFRKGGLSVVDDIPESNRGVWRHNVAEYLLGFQLRERISMMLDL